MTPLFASEKMAARLLDMSKPQFRKLVDEKLLPGPRIIGGVERWDVQALTMALRGEGPGQQRPTW